MQTRNLLLGFSLLVSIAASSAPLPLRLDVQPAVSTVTVGLPQQPMPPVVGTRFRFKVESSPDLVAWSAQGELEFTNSLPQLRLALGSPHQFYRLHSEVEDTGSAADGAEVFGYDRIFQQQLNAVGYPTPEQFAAAHPLSSNYLSALSFEPTQAKFWDAFSADPAVAKHLYDFRLNDAELGVFKTNGFVVSERLGSFSFADVFYRIFANDLPVFISADSILHAWHFSYQRLLEESEETQLAPALQHILDGMHAELARVPETVLNGPLQDSLQDADYFLTVARTLLMGQRVPTVTGQAAESATTDTLSAITNRQFIPEFPMFGAVRMVDFSQFTIRGHYERSINLGRYFQAFMWTARADFRVVAARPDPQSLRELGTALVLCHLMQASGQAERWQQLDQMIRVFVGRTDAMTFAQLQPLLTAAGIQSLESVTNLDQLRLIQEKMLQGDLGTQLITGDAWASPFGPQQLQLPRTFVLTGQRFNPDGWALNQVIFDRILWPEEIPGFTWFGKLVRRYPSALDVAYSVLGNRQVGYDIAERMSDVAHRAGFRDGLPYAHNLTALANTFDQIPPAAWEDSIYTRWLAALRELSAPTTGSSFPEAMRTRAWAMRTLNTQLASYTELKHDTVLYAKQPYTANILCEYPAGFVETVPAFWTKMREMATATAASLGQLPGTGTVQVLRPDRPSWDWIPVDLAQRQAARVAFCRNFAANVAVLEYLSSKELLQMPFADNEIAFIRGLMNRRDQPYYGATFNGWYPTLFYKDYGQLIDGGVDYNSPMSPWGVVGQDTTGANKADPLVTDVHTAPPDLFDLTGGVLHEGTGNVDLLLIAVDNGPDRAVYAGPLLSHYEFIVPGPTLKRLSDSEWQANFWMNPWQPAPAKSPTRPDWTRSYLVPK